MISFYGNIGIYHDHQKSFTNVSRKKITLVLSTLLICIVRPSHFGSRLTHLGGIRIETRTRTSSRSERSHVRAGVCVHARGPAGAAGRVWHTHARVVVPPFHTPILPIIYMSSRRRVTRLLSQLTPVACEATPEGQQGSSPYVIFVTGSNQGLGLALCQDAARRGFKVVAACRKASNELRQLASDSPPNLVRVLEDFEITSGKAVMGAVRRLQALEPGLRIDCLINNAGYRSENPIHTGRTPLLFKVVNRRTENPVDVKLRSVLVRLRSVLVKSRSVLVYPESVLIQ